MTRAPSLRHAVAAFTVAGVAAATLQIVGANPAVSQATRVAALRADTDPGLDPSASVWQRTPETELPLTAQNTTYPFGGGSIPVVRVRALHYGRQMYVRIEWDDSTRDDATDSVQRFADGVALELPARPGASVPSICMGQADGGVNIWQWRADRQHQLDWARANPNGYTDVSPSTDDLAFPARRVGNPVAARGRPAQDLVAQGFGTLGPAAAQAVEARGAYEHVGARAHWEVVLTRSFRSPGEGQPAFEIGEKTDIAFAVWNGSEHDRDGIKSVSEFAQLVVSSSRVPEKPLSAPWLWVAAIAGMLLLVGAVFSVLRSGWFRRL